MRRSVLLARLYGVHVCRDTRAQVCSESQRSAAEFSVPTREAVETCQELKEKGVTDQNNFLINNLIYTQIYAQYSTAK